jgi:hypothetical protein
MSLHDFIGNRFFGFDRHFFFILAVALIWLAAQQLGANKMVLGAIIVLGAALGIFLLMR